MKFFKILIWIDWTYQNLFHMIMLRVRSFDSEIAHSVFSILSQHHRWGQNLGIFLCDRQTFLIKLWMPICHNYFQANISKYFYVKEQYSSRPYICDRNSKIFFKSVISTQFGFWLLWLIKTGKGFRNSTQNSKNH